MNKLFFIVVFICFVTSLGFAQVNLDLPPTIPADYPTEIEGEKVYREPATKAMPKGGLYTFYQQIAKEMKYPPKAKKSNIKGRVFLLFIVQKDGSISNIKILKGIGYGCDEEAKRVLKLTKWIPAQDDGEIVHSTRQFAISFAGK